MSYHQGTEQKEERSKCSQCLIFYASETFQGLCSSCYKSSQLEKQMKKQETIPSCPSTPISVSEKELQQQLQQLSLNPPQKKQTDRKRCFGCNKKVGLLGIQCKCGFIFCNSHRLPENHQCSFNHKEKAREKLKKEIVKVDKMKIQEI